jgi:hypothetical protein
MSTSNGVAHGTPGVREQTDTGRLANTSANPQDTSANPRVERPIGQPAEAAAREDLHTHPATVDGGTDQARTISPSNQGDSEEVTEHIVGGEAGATVY